MIITTLCGQCYFFTHMLNRKVCALCALNPKAKPTEQVVVEIWTKINTPKCVHLRSFFRWFNRLLFHSSFFSLAQMNNNNKKIIRFLFCCVAQFDDHEESILESFIYEKKKIYGQVRKLRLNNATAYVPLCNTIKGEKNIPQYTS